MAESAYIHIPFCAHKCDFCDFAAFAGVDELMEDYCRIVCMEIEERQNTEANFEKLNTVFFGGGTPGYIKPNLLSLIIESLKQNIGIEKEAEITLETTPHTLSVEKCKSWLDMGINRISIGVESLIDTELKAMGRDHSRKQAIEGILTAKESGYENVALDLMYGLPEQTLDSWCQTLDDLFSLAPNHLSAYGLTIAQNSPLLKRYPRESASYPDEICFEKMYKLLVEKSRQNGLEQYEIANFAKRGFESKHNLAYWRNKEYLAFGVSAHRYHKGKRSSNLRSLKKYMRSYMESENVEVIDRATKAKESIFLGLRLREGIDIEFLYREFGINLIKDKESRIDELCRSGYLEFDSNRLRLSQKGILVSNTILAELI